MPIQRTQLEQAIAKQHESLPFSGVILIREHGTIVFEQSYGLANRSDSLPNTIDTRFAIASGAKTFTGVAICQLVEKGLLTFDTLLKDCIDITFPEFDPAITVHHLLTHSSGIPDYFDEAVMTDFAALWNEQPMYRIRTARDFLPMFQQGSMQFAPGTRFAYNNAGYIVLGLIIEHLTGMPFTEYVETNIFAPCQMADSGYYAMDHLPPRTAYGYIDDEQGDWRTNIYSVPIIGGPDGGVFTTAPDLVKFWDALLGNQLLTKETVATMLTAHYAAEESFYGYGVWLEKSNDSVSRYAMIGGDPGAAFYSTVYPEQEIQTTVIGNTETAMWPMQRCILSVIET